MECLDKPEADPVERWLAGLSTKSESDSGKENQKSAVRCRCCDGYITENQYLVPINNQTNHFFTNPSGLGFDLLSYEQASGCSVSGKLTDYFCWFEGFQWQYAYCKQCGVHLGWYYSCEGISGFFGLITDQLKMD